MPAQNDLFVDTSGWVSYFDRTDPLQQRVQAVIVQAGRQGRKLITTTNIITELVALLSLSRYHISRPQLLDHIRRVLSDPGTEVIHIDEATLFEAWRLLEARPDIRSGRWWTPRASP
jgi:predicted nucleic acid-binding protein